MDGARPAGKRGCFTRVTENFPALSSSLALLIPLLVGVASFFLFRERLTWIQLVGGSGLLSGCYLVIRASPRL